MSRTFYRNFTVRALDSIVLLQLDPGSSSIIHLLCHWTCLSLLVLAPPPTLLVSPVSKLVTYLPSFLRKVHLLTSKTFAIDVHSDHSDYHLLLLPFQPLPPALLSHLLCLIAP